MTSIAAICTNRLRSLSDQTDCAQHLLLTRYPPSHLADATKAVQKHTIASPITNRPWMTSRAAFCTNRLRPPSDQTDCAQQLFSFVPTGCGRPPTKQTARNNCFLTSDPPAHLADATKAV